MDCGKWKGGCLISCIGGNFRLRTQEGAVRLRAQRGSRSSSSAGGGLCQSLPVASMKIIAAQGFGEGARCGCVSGCSSAAVL